MLDLYLRNLPLTPPRPVGLADLMQTRFKLAIAGFKNGLYKSREDATKSHGVDPNTLRRRLLPLAESTVVRQCIYLANAGFPA